MIRWKKAGMC